MNLKKCLGVIVLFMLGSQVQAKPGSGSSSTNYLTEDYLNSQDFAKSVMKNVQTYKGADVDCKVENGLFAYYDFTNRCENCSTYCTSPFPDMRKRCIEKCEPFLINQLVLSRQVAAENRIKELELLTSRNSNEISSLRFCLYVVTTILVAVILAIPIGFITFHICFLTSRFAPHHSQVSPISDNEKRQFITQPVDRRDDDDNGYSTLQSSRTSV